MHIKHLLIVTLVLFISNPLFSQHDSLFHNYQLGIKFGGNYTITDTKIDENPSVVDGNEEIFQQTGAAEGDYGFNIGIFGIFKINKWLNLQAELDLMRVTGAFDYNTYTQLSGVPISGEIGEVEVENTYTDLEKTIGTGNYELKELFFQFPVMAKVTVGKDWKFAFGAGAYFRGGGFSNSTWNYDKRKYFREIAGTGNYAPEDPPLVTQNLSEKVKLVKDTNLGFIVDLGISRPISKTQSLFLEFRYQQPFSSESDIPYLSQQTISANIGFVTRIMRPMEEDEFEPDDGFGEDDDIKKMNRKKKRNEKDDDF
jgi:hypothetical protein